MKNYSCPYCDCSSLTRYGKVKNIQRYRCKNCKRTFRETSGTPLFRLHKVENVERYIEALKMGLSVRKAAVYAKISKNTSFIWRHKFLSSLKPKEFINCNESDGDVQIIKMEYSAKGRKKEPEKNRQPAKTLVTYRAGQLCLFKLEPTCLVKDASRVLRDVNIPNFVTVEANKLLKQAFRRAGRNREVDLVCVIKEDRNKLLKKLSELNEWMSRFKGVATKYLQQYWNWYITLHNIKDIRTNDQLFALNCCSERNLHSFEKMKDQ